jgi:hypothetical protein
MIKIFQIQPASSGFGMFQIAAESQSYNFHSATEYADNCASENCFVRGFVTSDTLDDTKGSIWDDEDMQAALVEAVENAQGKVYGGHGIIIAFMMGDGEIQLESCDVIEDQS